MLLTIHFAAAKFLETPELQLADEESKALAKALKNVSDQYDSKLNPKVLAWLQLGAVAGGIYGTRIYAIHARGVAQAKRPAPNVVEMRGSVPKGAVVPEAGAGGVTEARTPADMFGMNYSANIPEVM